MAPDSGFLVLRLGRAAAKVSRKSLGSCRFWGVLGRRAAKVLRKSLGSRRLWKALGSRRFWGGLGHRTCRSAPRKPESGVRSLRIPDFRSGSRIGGCRGQNLKQLQPGHPNEPQMIRQSPFRNRNPESKPDSGRYMPFRIPDLWSSKKARKSLGSRGLGGGRPKCSGSIQGRSLPDSGFTVIQNAQEVLRVAGLGRRAGRPNYRQSNKKPQSTHKNTIKTQKYYGPKPFKNTKHTRKHSQIINKMVSGRNTSPKEIRP